MYRYRTFLFIGVVVIAAAAIAAVLWTRAGADETTKVDVAKVAAEARKDRGATKERAGLRPEPGTYRYAVDGYDEVSALGGSKHEYDSEVPAIVELRSGCEWTIEFLYAEERRVKSTFCTTAEGTRMLQTANTVEFFGVGQTDLQKCDARAWITTAAGTPGTKQNFTCKNDDRSVAHASVVAGSAGAPKLDGVAAGDLIHVRDEFTITGNTTGTTSNDAWYLASGLPVAFTEKSTTRSKSPLGDTDYIIDSKVELVSTKPE